MRVAILKSKWKASGGLEKYATRIANAFLAKGAELTVLTTEEESSSSPIQFHSIKTIAWPGFVRLEQFDRFTQNWLKDHPVDLIFGMDRNRFQTHIRAGNGVHAAYLKTRNPLCKLNPLHRKILSIEKSGFESPSLQKLFTNSHMVRNEILEYYKTDPRKIEVIHNGVEWAEMHNDFANWKSFHNPNTYHFLFIGNGFSRKGLDPLLIGLSRLKNRNFQLSIIGKDKKSDHYKVKAAQLGLTSHVSFIGHTSETPKYYQMSDCLVIPSFYDPFANVTVEALAMGLFVLSSKTNGGHEILTKENGAIIEKLESPDAMVAALEVAMMRPKTEMSALAIRQSVQHLDFSHQMSKMMAFCG